MIRRLSNRRLTLALAVTIAMVVASSDLLLGAPPEPLPVAHVRVWKTDLRAFLTLNVFLTAASGKHPVRHEIGRSGPGFLFADYVEVPAGACTLNLEANDKQILVKMNADLEANGFTTVIVREPSMAGAQPRVEIINDGVAERSEASGNMQITMRSFVAGLSDVNISIGSSIKAQFPGSDNFLQIRGLREDLYAIHTAGKDPTGKPFEWDTDADLRAFHHQTLLIYPDAYGRIRPRLSVDGEVSVEPSSNKDNQGQR